MGVEVSLVQIGIALLILAAVGGAGYAIVSTYNGKIEEAAKWKDAAEKEKGNAETWKAATNFWMGEKEKADKVILERDRKYAVVAKDVARLRDERKQAENTDPSLQAWSNTPLPAFVVQQLRSVAADPGSSPHPKDGDTGKPSFWDRTASVSRPHKR